MLDSIALYLGYTMMILGGVSLIPIFIYFTADEAIRCIYGMKTIWDFAWWMREQKRKAKAQNEVSP